MISRLTTLATTFAILATASIAFATGNGPVTLDAPATAAATSTAKQLRTVQLPTVVVVAKRTPAL